jgi:amino acid adenylation domain-containing protein
MHDGVISKIRAKDFRKMKKNNFQDKLIEGFQRYSRNTAIEYGDKAITYSEIWKKSSYISNWIVDKGIKKGSFIGIYLEDKIDLILIIIGILKARCAFVILDNVLPVKRIEAMIQSTHLEFIFLDVKNQEKLSLSGSWDNQLEKTIKAFIVDDSFYQIDDSLLLTTNAIEYNHEDKIYIYFTSGSTGVPKAIVGKNKSLLHFIDWEIGTFGIGETFRISQFTTPGFDAFLRDVFVPLCSGGTVCIPQNKEIMMDRDALIHWIDINRIDLIHCVPSLFRLFNPGDGVSGNYKHLKYVLLSGERIPPPELKKWYNTFGKRIQLVNLYGPTETTMTKTCYFIQESDSQRANTPIGKPIKGSRIFILDEDMNPCGKGFIGEIYIRTPFMTFGYYNDPQLTKEKFIPNPFTQDTNDWFYKTGDLGRILTDGNIELTGRIDRQVKVSGVRVELEEIECILVDHPSVKEAVVIKEEVSNNDGWLYAFVTGSERSTMDEESLASTLTEYLLEKLPSYMVPVRILKIEKIPRKPNGKVDYQRLPRPIKEEKTVDIATANEVEKRLLEIWSEIFQRGNLGITNNFFELGGNSLNIMTLISRIHQEFEVRVPLGVIFNNPTIEKQAKIIQSEKKEKHVMIDLVEEKEYYTLSSAQNGLYIIDKINVKSVNYNISAVLELEGVLEKERLENIFLQLIHRHESLRTSFAEIEGNPVQQIHDDVEFEIEYSDLTPEDKEDCSSQLATSAVKNFIRPFNLSRAPLFRVGLIKIEKTKHLLMVDMHHIITDGASIAILTQDFAAIYNGEKLPALRLQYKDYSEWQKIQQQKENIKQQGIYWIKQFEGKIPQLNLPGDYPRPAIKSVEGNSISFEIEPDETKAIKEWILEEDVTLFMLLLAVYNVLLWKVTGQEDIVVGSGVMGRSHPDLNSIIGLFINMLALRNYPEGEKPFREFLMEVRESTLNAFENQDYHFEDLVKQVLETRDPGRSPLFDVIFSVQNLRFPTEELPNLKIKPFPHEKPISKYDMFVLATEVGDKLNFTMDYSTKIFKQETIEKFIEYFKKIVSSVLENKDIKLTDIKISQVLEDSKSDILQFDFGF